MPGDPDPPSDLVEPRWFKRSVVIVTAALCATVLLLALRLHAVQRAEAEAMTHRALERVLVCDTIVGQVKSALGEPDDHLFELTTAAGVGSLSTFCTGNEISYDSSVTRAAVYCAVKNAGLPDKGRCYVDFAREVIRAYEQAAASR